MTAVAKKVLISMFEALQTALTGSSFPDSCAGSHGEASEPIS